MSYQNGYAPQAPILTDQRPQDGAVVAIAWICAVLSGLYMLPWAIAATRGKSNQAMIGLLNLLLGWTFVGWVVTLVMACTAHRPVGVPVAVFVAPQQPQQAQPMYTQAPPAQLPSGPSAPPVPAGWYASPSNQGQEYWDGVAWTGHRAP